MTWGVIIDVPAPIEVYDALHAELLKRTGGQVAGLLLHVARPTADGFQLVEVWNSRADFERSAARDLAPVLAGLAGGRASPSGDRTETEFEVRGLVLPGARMAS